MKLILTNWEMRSSWNSIRGGGLARVILTNWEMRSSWNVPYAPFARGAILTNWEMRSSWNTSCCPVPRRSEEHTSELQSIMRISYAVLCLKQTKLTKLHKLPTLTSHHN